MRVSLAVVLNLAFLWEVSHSMVLKDNARHNKNHFSLPPATTIDSETASRRRFLSCLPPILGALVAIPSSPAAAAPPIAIIAEELGYFPVQNKQGDVVYVAQRVNRESSKQAIALATQLTQKGVYMAGTYWCPHTSRQKELFGRQAWALIKYIECSPKGYGAQPKLCVEQKVDGYPSWLFPGGRQLAGERPLSELAKEIGFQNFRESLEQNVPPMLGSQSCQLKK